MEKKETVTDNWSITFLHILYSGFISWEKFVSVAIRESIIFENQPGIGFGHYDILRCPTWLCAYLPSTVLIMASFQCTDSKAVGPLSTATPVLIITVANKEMKQVVDCMEWEEPY